MRLLNAPAVTVVTTVHLKPTTRVAIQSVLAQTRLDDVQLLVVDSGQWRGPAGSFLPDAHSVLMAGVHDDYAGHPNVAWTFTGEEPGLADRLCPVAWATNEAIRKGHVRGRYVCTFYDDDRYHPTFIERMAGYLDEHPEAGAVWCSQNRIQLMPDDTETLVGVIVADGPRSGAGSWDCRVDGGQVMFRREVLDAIGDPWLPEEPGDSCRHSDGIFLERMGAVVGTVPAIRDVLMDHRFTPYSTYSPSVAWGGV